jgi:molybdate/tungstate transport system substrate-binding protein
MRRIGLVAIGCATVALAGCGSSVSGGGGDAHGSVDVLYAGSLVSLMQNQIGPAFKSETGYSVSGISAGSTALATQIKGKVHAADVFISASPDANTSLQGSANGDWVSWYATFASSGLVLGYNPQSKFADDLKSKPWYQVITEPGFRLGTTDPATDPKGKLAAQALTDTASSQHLPALAKITQKQSTVFPEETLIGRLQAGQLDAGFFYRSEAVGAEIRTVPQVGVDLKASYTVTILDRAPHEKAAEAFVSYLLGPNGRAVLEQDGFELVTPPTVTGAGVPSPVSKVLAGS